MAEKQELEKLTLRVPADVRRALRIEAAERGVSMSDIVVEALMTRIRFIPRQLRKENEP